MADRFYAKFDNNINGCGKFWGRMWGKIDIASEPYIPLFSPTYIPVYIRSGTSIPIIDKIANICRFTVSASAMRDARIALSVSVAIGQFV